MTEHPTVELIRAQLPDLVAIRRDIHAHPEMGLEEVRTSALVADRLREWGVEVTEGVGKTGVVGTITGRLPGQRAIGLRADMDALAIEEATGAAHASQNPGVMHACGHDGHTTMLLGAARHLAEHRDFAGTVHLIFQPAEEGRGGAQAMLADGLLERFPCDALYGMHTSPGMKVGQFGIREGVAMAGGCMFHVRFTGNGGHGGATPHLSVDLSIVQAHFVLGLQTIVGRNISAFDPAVISVGHIGGGARDSANVMPAEMTVSGTARYYKDFDEGDHRASHPRPGGGAGFTARRRGGGGVRLGGRTAGERRGADRGGGGRCLRSGGGRGGGPRHAAHRRRRGFRVYAEAEAGRFHPHRKWRGVGGRAHATVRFQ